MAKITGTNGSDRVRGDLEKDNEFLGFGSGFDMAVGGNRTDIFRLTTVDRSADLYDGGAGRDLIDLSQVTLPARTEIRLDDRGTAGSIAVTGQSIGGSPTTLATLLDIEDVIGTSGDDRIYGNAEANALSGGEGGDLIFGGAGDDTLDAGAGNDRLNAGTGNDSVFGGAGDDVITATLDRRIAGNTDWFDGGAGRDTLDFAAGGSGFLGVVVSLSTEFAPSMIGIPTTERSIDQGFVSSRTVSGSIQSSHTEAKITGIEDAIGTGGDDTLIGDRVNNSLWGGHGNDLLSGETGADTLYGDAGDDVFESYADGALDFIIGGTGTDTVTYHRSSNALIVTLADGDGVGNATTLGSGGFGPTFVREDHLSQIENVTGSRLNDRIQGNAEANVLLGRAGDDVLLGMAGDDILHGGAGTDILTGGAGADTFRVWELGTGTASDTIRDFVSGTDTLDLSGFFSNARANHMATSPQEAPDLIGSRAFSGSGEAELCIVRVGGESRVQVDFGDGSLGALDVEVRVQGTIGFGDILF